MAGTVNVDTLVETVRGRPAKLPYTPIDSRRPLYYIEASELSDLADRARLSDQRRREVLDLKPAATALVKDRDRLARRVAELEAALLYACLDLTGGDRARADRRRSSYFAEDREKGCAYHIIYLHGCRECAALAGDGGGASCCCPSGSYSPGAVHEPYCPLAGDGGGA